MSLTRTSAVAASAVLLGEMTSGEVLLDDALYSARAHLQLRRWSRRAASATEPETDG
jgi:hypothetical protein